MSYFTQTVMILGVIDFGIGAVGSLLVRPVVLCNDP